jgi:hypothetical protein
MGKYRLEVHAARTVDVSAVSRMRKKLKQSAEFQALDEAVQKEALEKIKTEVLDARYEYLLLCSSLY